MSSQSPVSAPSVSEVKDAVRFTATDRAALRAFGAVVTKAEFLAAFQERSPAQSQDEPRRALVAAEVAFCKTLLEREHWDDEAWLERLSSRWLACQRSGGADITVVRLASALLDAVRDTLTSHGGAPGRPEWDILAAVERLMQVVMARLFADTLERLRHQVAASADSVASGGLPGREIFVAMLQRWLGGESPASVGLVLIRIDFGRVGLHLLTATRDRLRRVLGDAMLQGLRPGDLLCAVGDHEWALLMPDLRNGALTALAANRMLETCRDVLEGDFQHLRGLIHAGGASAPEDAQTPEILEHAARTALHEAVGAGNPFACFRADMAEAMAQEVELEKALVQAMNRPPFELWLQPQVRLATGQCESAEILIRWQREDGQWVAPATLVDTASRLGVMPELSRWLITRTGRLMAELEAAGADVRVSLNLVAQDLVDEETPDLVEQALATWHARADKLCLEITEGALIGDRARASGIIGRLRKLGCGVSLDDFGTGFSSMGYLRDLPVNELKIDQLFIRRMLDSERDRAIVVAVHALASGLGIEVVAEGVEDEATAQTLLKLGCTYGQGFYFARAMPQDNFVAWLRSRR